jgi:hypothetical protein
MDGEALARSWKDPDLRAWPDDEHPSGQMYLQLRSIVGGGSHLLRGFGLEDLDTFEDDTSWPTYSGP